MRTTCPIPKCNHSVPTGSMLLCRRHWFMVPKEVRDAVWSEHRLAPKSTAHYAAVREAISAVMEKEKEEAP